MRRLIACLLIGSPGLVLFVPTTAPAWDILDPWPAQPIEQPASQVEPSSSEPPPMSRAISQSGSGRHGVPTASFPSTFEPPRMMSVQPSTGTWAVVVDQPVDPWAEPTAADGAIAGASQPSARLGDGGTSTGSRSQIPPITAEIVEGTDSGWATSSVVAPIDPWP